MTAPRVILASASPRRRELLALVGIAHEVRPAAVDETPRPGEHHAAYAERLAREKASAVAAGAPEAVVIAADTIVVLGGVVLGKPADARDAVRMLAMLRGCSHTVQTAVAVAFRGALVSGLETVSVTFRDLSDAEIAAYVDTGEPLDKAGAYGIQGFGATIVERVDGDYFSVMGLGLRRLVALCERVGLTYHFARGLAAG